MKKDSSQWARIKYSQGGLGGGPMQWGSELLYYRSSFAATIDVISTILTGNCLGMHIMHSVSDTCLA